MGGGGVGGLSQSIEDVAKTSVWHRTLFEPGHNISYNLLSSFIEMDCFFLTSEQNSFDGGMRDGTERSFEVDHLATYTSKSGRFMNVFFLLDKGFNFQGPVVQNIVSLMSSLVVKMLTVLVSTISNSQVFFAGKWVAKATPIFSAKILGYMPYLIKF